MTSTPYPVTTAELRQIAESLEKQAQTLRRKADQIEQSVGRKEQSAELFSRLDRLGQEHAAALGWDEKKLDSADLASARAHNVPPETVAFYTRRAIRAKAAGDRAARDREILRLARLGHTNSEISSRVGVSTRTISKAITAAFRTPK